MSCQPTIDNVHSWPSSPSRRWLARCDLCRTRRLVADYFEGYLCAEFRRGPSVGFCAVCGQEPQDHPPHDGWLWVCSGCLVEAKSGHYVPVGGGARGTRRCIGSRG